MKDLQAVIQKFSENYNVNRNTLPNSDTLEEELFMLSGISLSDEHSFLLIPLDSPELRYFGSTCGELGNKLFSNKSLVTFLKNRKVSQVLGIVYQPHSNSACSNDSVALSAIALPIVGKEGHIFEHLVSKNNGSFRYERSQVSGWSVYESE